MKKLILTAWILSGVLNAPLIQAASLPGIDAEMAGREVSEADRLLVDKFLKAAPPPCCDRPEPYSEEVASRPHLAPVLAAALQDTSSPIREKRVNIIYMLGRMGNPQVFEDLAALYDVSQPAAARIRLMTSLGACVRSSTLKQYLDMVMQDPDVLTWLQKTTGSSCGLDPACWKGFFSTDSEQKSLREFNDRCREASKPILG